MTADFADATMLIALARLQGSPAVIDDATHIRRDHLTPVGRDECPAINLLDGEDVPRRSGSCDAERAFEFVARVIVRNDAGMSVAREIGRGVLERLNPENAAVPSYPNGVSIEFGPVRPMWELADEDIVALDLHFTAKYTAPAFALGELA